MKFRKQFRDWMKDVIADVAHVANKQDRMEEDCRIQFDVLNSGIADLEAKIDAVADDVDECCALLAEIKVILETGSKRKGKRKGGR